LLLFVVLNAFCCVLQALPPPPGTGVPRADNSQYQLY
jgi:hypothetical protein